MQTIEASVGNVGTYCVHSGIHKKTVITRFPELKYSFLSADSEGGVPWVFVDVGMQTIEAIVGNVGTYCVHSGIHKKNSYNSIPRAQI